LFTFSAKVIIVKPVITFIAAICSFSYSYSQTTYPIPSGYKIFRDYDQKAFQVEKDLDGDSKTDMVVVLAKDGSEWDNAVAVYLSSKHASGSKPFVFSFHSNHYNVEVIKNVLNIGACFGNGRYCKSLKFRWEANIKQLRLIGYDEESFGNAMHEGAYTKTVNLLTGKYDLMGAKWKKTLVKTVKLPVITAANLSQSKFEQLENVGAEYLSR
jgi:hypothetical protein